MKPKLPRGWLLLFSLFLMGCSADQDNGIAPEAENKFIFNGVTYDLISAIITDQNSSSNNPSEIGISLFNKTSSEVTSNTNLDDVSYVYFDFEGENIQNITYNQFNDYDISIDGSFVDDEFNPGTILLSDVDETSDTYAQSGSVTVTNFTQFNIAFTFTFTRNDGQVISGSYDGQYFNP